MGSGQLNEGPLLGDEREGNHPPGLSQKERLTQSEYDEIRRGALISELLLDSSARRQATRVSQPTQEVLSMFGYSGNHALATLSGWRRTKMHPQNGRSRKWAATQPVQDALALRDVRIRQEVLLPISTQLSWANALPHGSTKEGETGGLHQTDCR